MSKMSPILVTGASGLLGVAVVLAAQQAGHQVVGLYGMHPVHFPGVESIPLDLTDPHDISRIAEHIRPRLVIHTAAWTSVEGCEVEPERAFRINAEAAGQVAAAAHAAGARTIYISTDSVFDGRQGGYTEADRPHPLNVYARSKLAGEHATCASDPHALVLRCNLYGWNVQPKKSLAEWILDSLEAGQSITGFDDVIFAPLLTEDLADILLALAEQEAAGLYHLASLDAISKYAFARLVAEVFGLNADLVRPGKLGDPATGQQALDAPRPLNTSLDPARARTLLGRQRADWPTLRSGLEHFRDLRHSRQDPRLSSCIALIQP